MLQLENRGCLDQLLSTVPSEMLFEIFANLPFDDLLNIFTLNREVYKQLMESEFFFEKLCINYCKLHDLDRSEYEKIVEGVMKKGSEKNLKYFVLIELITCYGYSWDTKFEYYERKCGYELTPSTLKTNAHPTHGDFYTVKANRLLNPGRFYKWKIKLDVYNPEATDNLFKSMIGIESLGFFPFNNQDSNDVIGWESTSKGIALITGTSEIITSACLASNTTVKLRRDFQTGDIIQVEFDYTKVSQDIEPLDPIGGYYSNFLIADENLLGSVRFSLIRNHQIIELANWIPFGDARFAPYVPAVSVNEGQILSFFNE